MTNQTMIDAQDYLTIKNNDQIKRIVDIDTLRMNHSTIEIITFLKGYLKEKEKSLKNVILIDKTHCKVDEIVTVMFRLHMSIKTLEDGNCIYLERKEVRKVVKFKQGTAESCGV
jgi:hypothetical protein